MKKTKIKVAIFMIMAVMSGIIMVLGCTQDEMADLNSNKYDIWNLEEKVDTEFMPLNSVPEWIKDKVTEKEYEAWVRLSSRYEIDYSVLSLELTESQKKDLYQYIDSLWIQSQDSVGQSSLGYFTVAVQSVFKRIETLQNPEAGKEIHGEKGPIVIHKVNGAGEAFVKAMVSYTANAGLTEILSASVRVYKDGPAAIDFNGSSSVNIEGRGVVVNCGGTLVYTTGRGNLSSDFNKSVRVLILP
ncbi:hypothetical protein [Paraprevotella clara]|uniref:hypothetical protein n=1 Tax=Paraprevotella clara TaxID=454154 RepID=UPI0026773FA2|nr:hypothetical protein [Paraprevotella clara]